MRTAKQTAWPQPAELLAAAPDDYVFRERLEPLAGFLYDRDRHVSGLTQFDVGDASGFSLMRSADDFAGVAVAQFGIGRLYLFLHGFLHDRSLRGSWPLAL